MKDQTDTQTAELFPILEPKRRGRIPTGKAKTTAERQAAYRRRKSARGGTDNNGHKHVDWWIDYRRWSELDCLASYHGKTPLQIVEQLIDQANRDLMATMTQAQYFDYVDKKLHVTQKEQGA
ncbi:hypothetical protein [Methylomonas koyamae]|uniref:hypothetical protein n=1 Tax=Methylomonas koyamae TaxID=702114 RepID=UPI00112C407A|nr:hypothetical protein [Methylomonas koyamae]TPQ24988.1 hypothetical protein C2U68_17055 [Methylomonas koyamae]